jgi:hypothetical protein
VAVVDLQTFKTYLKVNRSADLPDDALLQGFLDAAVTLAGEMTGRQFETAGVASARTFYGTGSRILRVDDYTSLTSIADSESVAVTPSTYLPVNVRTGMPYDSIISTGRWSTSCDFPNYTVTASWGWTTFPAAVQQAVLILAKDIASNRDVTFGIASFAEYGIKAKENPQVRMLLMPYDRRVFLDGA